MKLNQEIITSDICLFLGAGASAPFGKALMSSFIDNVYKKTSDQASLNLLNFLCKTKAKDLEAVLEELSLFIDKKFYLGVNWSTYGNPLAQFSGDFRDVRDIAINLYSTIKKEIIEHYRGVDNIDLVKEKYTPLFELMKRELEIQTVTIPIFTTNYDDIIDDLCSQDDNFNLINGACYVKKHRDNILSFDEIIKFKPEQGKINITLFKLHGSICWELDPKKKIIRITPNPIDDAADPEVSKVYIAPTQEKIASNFPYRDLYEYLHRCLDNSKLLIVIGYSFRDYDTLTKMKSSLDFNKNLRIVIFNDEAENLKKDLFGEYEDRIIPIPYFFGSTDEEKYLALIREEIKKVKVKHVSS